MADSGCIGGVAAGSRGLLDSSWEDNELLGWLIISIYSTLQVMGGGLDSMPQ